MRPASLIRVPLLCFLLCVASLTARASEFELITQTPAGAKALRLGGVPAIRMTGMIVTGDADKLRALLEKIAADTKPKPGEPLTFMEMSSMGGTLDEGFQIGTLMRKYRVIAIVRQHDFCMSSCAFAFLGGNAHRPSSPYPTECNLEIGGKVAFHNFFLNRAAIREGTSEDPVASRMQGFADARGGAAMLVRYAGDMGMAPNFVASLMGRPVEDFQYIETVGQFLSFHVCPIGLDRPTAALDVQAKNVCVNSLGKLPEGKPKVTPMTAAQAKLYMLQRMQDNMQASKAKGRLAAQIASATRSKDEIDKLYDDLSAAGMALPEIMGPTFEIGTELDGGYEPACYVSLSAEEPDKFDIVVQGPRGFTSPPHDPPQNARRLFLYSRDDVINPRPH
ncbi:MAG TPA: hypothetical protein VMI56_07940 [Reyranella sp.]|nr:hypothetical protein [Reyranella sp.]